MSFQIVPGDPRSTVIVHVPHSSREIPVPVWAEIILDDEALERTLDGMTDTVRQFVVAPKSGLTPIDTLAPASRSTTSHPALETSGRHSWCSSSATAKDMGAISGGASSPSRATSACKPLSPGPPKAPTHLCRTHALLKDNPSALSQLSACWMVSPISLQGFTSNLKTRGLNP